MGILALVNVSNVNWFLWLVTIDKADLCGVCTDLRQEYLSSGIPAAALAGGLYKCKRTVLFQSWGSVSLK